VAGESAGGAVARAREELPADGCRFREECPHAVEACAGGDQPPFHAVDGSTAGSREHGDHTASCVYYGPDWDPARVLADSASVSGGEDSD
jgi:peptide/nickel transport system ATP-binding protein